MMNTITLFFGAVLLAGFAWIIVLLRSQEKSADGGAISALQAEISLKDQKLGEVSKELQHEKSQREFMSGKNKEQFAQLTASKAEIKFLTQEKERLANEVAKFKAEGKQKEDRLNEELRKLDKSRAMLEDEKQRIRREDEERLQKEMSERDRMWSEHEEKVKSILTELCQRPQYGFRTYDNNTLPEGFGGKLKPDFMIELLDQFVIFDAKASRSDNLQTYVTNAVKTTAEKIKNNPKIYPTVFFVVPVEAIGTLGKTYFYEHTFDFFVISPESIPVVLSTFKKITSYEFAEQMDPQERENIVNLIAEFDHHINFRNAVDVLSVESGMNVLSKSAVLRMDLRKEIDLKKSKMKPRQFTPSDLKTLTIDSAYQEERVHQLISPKAAVDADVMKSAKSVILKKG